MSSSWKFYVSYGLFDKDLCDVITKWITNGRAKNKRSDTEVWGEYGGERLFAVDGGYVATVQVPFMKSSPYDLFGATWLDREYDPYSRASYGNCEHAFDDTQLHRGKYMVAALECFFAELSETERNLLCQKVDVAYLRGETRCRSFVSEYAADWEYRQKEAHEELYIDDGVLEGWHPMPFRHDIVIPEHIHTIGQDAFSNTVDRGAFMNGYDVQTGKSTGEWIYPAYLRSITFPYGLKTIDKKAFYKVMTLKELNLPDGLQTIGNQAFRDCSCLTHITIPDSVTRIEDAAFQGCKNLESVTLSANLRTIPKQAFRDCPKLKHLVIPEGVKDIKSGAFQGCEILTVTYVGQPPKCAPDAFKGCVALLSAETPDAVYEAAWKEASKEGKLEIALKHILSDWELRECEKVYITRAFGLVIPALIRENMAKALPTVFALKNKVPLDLMDAWIAESENAPAVQAFLTDYKSTHYTEKESAKAKKQAAEKQEGVRERTVADWKKIFKWKTNDGSITITGLKSSDPIIEIPSKIGKTEVTEIDFFAFRDCKTLEAVVIPKSVKKVGDCAFSGCTNLKSVTIAAGVYEIGYSCFEDCTGLTSIALPEGIGKIGFLAFDGCINLSSVSFPSSLREIGVRAFANTAWFRAQPSLVIANNILCSYQGQDAAVKIPEGVTTINNEAFAGCEHLVSVVIPEGVTDICAKAFAGCEHLTSVVIPEGVTDICAEAFKGCKNLKSITVPKSVRNVGRDAFENTPWLAAQPSMVIVNDVLYCYRGYDKQVIVPDGVRKIGSCAFLECASLTSVVLPQGVEEIGNAAFCDCRNLTAVFIPESVIEFDRNCVVWECKKLKIHGKAGSYAQALAEENGIPFKAE